jgi:hypothetical protein
LGLGDLGEGVAGAHGELCGSGERGREVKLGAGDDVVGIEDAGVDGEEVAPAKTLAESLRGELPEGVAGLDGDDISFGGCCGSDGGFGAGLGDGCRWRRWGDADGGRPRRSEARRSENRGGRTSERRALYEWLRRSEARVRWVENRERRMRRLERRRWRGESRGVCLEDWRRRGGVEIGRGRSWLDSRERRTQRLQRRPG